MKKILFIFAVSFSVFAQNSIYVPNGLTGRRVTYANSEIAILVRPNELIFKSNEIDPKTKTIPIFVWRTRNEENPCAVQMLNVKVVQGPQLFVVPKNTFKPFDGIMFESRNWYDLTTNLTEIGGNTVISWPEENPHPHPTGEVIFCPPDESSDTNTSSVLSVNHVKFFKE